MQYPAGFARFTTHVWAKIFSVLLIVSLFFVLTPTDNRGDFDYSDFSHQLSLINNTQPLAPIRIVEAGDDKGFKLRLTKESVDEELDLQVVDLDFSGIKLSVIESKSTGQIFISPFSRFGFLSLIKDRRTGDREILAVQREQGNGQKTTDNQIDRIAYPKKNRVTLPILSNKPTFLVLLC